MTVSEAPLRCLPGDHVLVCHCGDDVAAGGGHHGDHGAVLMGCAACHATPAEIDAERRAPLSLMELANLTDLLCRWRLAHPEDQEVGPVLARVAAELEVLVAPWRAALGEMAAKLGAVKGIPRAKLLRADPIRIHGFDGSERIIEGARGEPTGPEWPTYEGTTE